MTAPWPTAIVGFGRMGRGYAADPVMARHFPYAAHSQVLADHPDFDWRLVVDPDPAALESASEDWQVPHTAPTTSDLGEVAAEIELAVLATAPDARTGLLDAFPNLKAVLVEKPLGTSLESAAEFLAACDARGIMVQVNLWRRADETLRRIAAGELIDRIGPIAGGIALYGNGLHNNGTHIVDMVRMLCGEPASGLLTGPDEGFAEGPIPGDRNPAFTLVLESGAPIAFQPARFSDWRENGLIVWGERGRFEIMNEGLSIAFFPRHENRAMQGEREIAFDAPQPVASGAGTALYAMYDNLAAALENGSADLLASPGRSALATARVVDAIARASTAAPKIALDG